MANPKYYITQSTRLTDPVSRSFFLDPGFNSLTVANVSFIGSQSATGDTVYTLPVDYPGSNGYVLASTTAGVLSWAASSSGDPDQNLWETVAADSGSEAAPSTTATLTVAGGEGVNTSISGTTLTVGCEDASTSNKGVASFDSDNFSVSSGVVSLSSYPSFYAYRATSNQPINDNTLTKVQFNAERFDTGSAYDASTNYRFLPTKAGKYLVGACVKISSLLVNDYYAIHIYLNGSSYSRVEYEAGTTRAISEHVSTIIDLDGASDYVEIYVHQITGSTQVVPLGAGLSYFYGARVDV